jgi:hypothetical protein
VAFPPNAVFDDSDSYIEEEEEDYDEMEFCTDLYQLFGLESGIERELQHRFDKLPIHRLVYYQSYHQGVLQILIAAINMRLGLHRTSGNEIDLTGNH